MDLFGPNAFLCFLFVLCVIGAVIGVIIHIEQRVRPDKMASLAYDLGYDFEPDDIAGSFLSQNGAFSAIEWARDPEALNIMSGTLDGMPIKIFDQRYRGPKSSHGYKTNIVVDTDFRLKYLHIQPKTLETRLNSVLGTKFTDFGDAKEFDKDYCVVSESSFVAHELLSPLIRAYLIRHKLWDIEFRAGSVMFCPAKTSPQLAIKEIVTAIEFVRGFLRLISEEMRITEGKNPK